MQRGCCFCADDSSVPALATMLDEGLRALPSVVVESNADASDRLEIPRNEQATVTWVKAEPSRPGAMLRDAIAAWSVPEGCGSIWVACEALAVRAIRHDLLVDRGLSRGYVVTRGYSRDGATNHPDHDFGENTD